MYIKQNGKWSTSSDIDNSKVDLAQPHIVGMYNNKPVYEVTLEVITASKKNTEIVTDITDIVPYGSSILFSNLIIHNSAGTYVNANYYFSSTDYCCYMIITTSNLIRIYGKHSIDSANNRPLFATIRFIKPE